MPGFPHQPGLRRASTYTVEPDGALLVVSWEHECAREKPHVHEPCRRLVLGAVNPANMQRAHVLVLLRQLGEMVLVRLPLMVKAGVEVEQHVLQVHSRPPPRALSQAKCTSFRRLQPTPCLLHVHGGQKRLAHYVEDGARVDARHWLRLDVVGHCRLLQVAPQQRRQARAAQLAVHAVAVVVLKVL
eukprot:scaffold659_cov329-Prasinococcus_capsulatus_cf.AAC.14